MNNQFWLIADGNGNNFRVTVTDKQKSYDGKDLVSVKGFVEEVVGWDEETQTAYETERYLSFYMKWDECCHIDFGAEDSPGYLHLCGKQSWQIHYQVMTALFDWAAKTIPMRM